MSHPEDILDVALIADDADQRRLLTRVLEVAGFTIRAAGSADAGTQLFKFRPKVVLCDVGLPDVDGVQFVRSLRDDLHLPGTYFILMSANAGKEKAIDALNAGADDYLGKPIDRHDLLARVRVGIRTWTSHQQFRLAAITDGLTGLHNQDHFHQLLNNELKRSRRFGNPLAIIMLDVDHFKAINDNYGHLVGNQALRRLAAVLRETVREVDVLARFGGDEMIVLLPQTTISTAVGVAERIRLAVTDQVRLDAAPEYPVSASLGVSGTDDPRASHVTDLLELADRALYTSKHQGRNRVTSCIGLEPGGEVEAVIERSDVDQLRRQLVSLALRAKETYMQSVASLLQALDEKDPYSARHAVNVAFYAQAIAEELGCDASMIQTVHNAGLLHDIGKVGVPDAILMKSTFLNSLERMVLEQVPIIGMRIVEHLRILDAEVPIIRHQREHYDGSGFPSGLGGDRIPIGSRILLVADAFDAMTTDRVYRHRRPIDEVLTEIKGLAGRQFDPQAVDALTRILSRDRAAWQRRIDDTVAALRAPTLPESLVT